MSKNGSNGASYEEYMSHVLASYAQYGSFPGAMFPSGVGY